MIPVYWALVLAHLVGDFLLQQERHALTKHSDLRSLVIHCAQYTATFIPVLFVYGLSIWWALWIFLLHVAVDNGKFVQWWSIHVTGQKKPDFWLLVVRDQVLHLLVLVPVAW